MTSTGPPDYTTREMFVFEGVDYDMLPEGYIKEKNNDCNALHFRCIENTILMNHVCGWNYHTYYFEEYSGPCEIELRNCFHRLKNNFPIKGNNMRNNYIYYNGEGRNCVHYARMGGNMLENYFGAGRRSIFKKLGLDRKPYKVRFHVVPDYKYEVS
ncbi:uncharacterized protein LOC135083958 [Ostrinia nubilalis]|uniref:uncharacterized protein LOC135083958 n=1 Tax=Ostrinia nubilalis TaxID=29057 RepID=UPI0030825AEC